MPEQALLSVGEAARQLGLSADRVRQLERSGVLPAQRTALGRLFTSTDVKRLAAERTARLSRQAEPV